MRMCKWNKFRGNNSTTIPLQSANTRERILRRRSLGPKRRSSLYRDLGWLMDSAPFCCRVLSQIYSVLLPFWYINFYSIWFAAIAMIIGRKGVRSQRRFPSKSLSLSPSLPFLLRSFFSSFLVVSSTTCFHSSRDQRLLEKDISRLSLILNAPLGLSRRPSWKTMLCYVYALKFFRFTTCSQIVFFFKFSSFFKFSLSIFAIKNSKKIFWKDMYDSAINYIPINFFDL